MSFVLEKDLPASDAIEADVIQLLGREPISPMLISECLRLFDLATIAIAGFIVHRIYVEPSPSDIDNRYFSSIALATVIAGFAAQWLKAYSVEVVFESWIGVRRALMAWLVAFAICLTVVFTLKITSSYSRVWAVSWFVLAGAMLVIVHYLFRVAARRWAAQGRLANRSIVIGVGEQARRLAALLKSKGDLRTHILGFVDEPGTVEGTDRRVDGRLLGGVDSLLLLIRRNMVDEVI